MNQQLSSHIQHCIQDVAALVKSRDWRNAYEMLATENRKSPNHILERAMVDILLQACDASGVVEVAKPGDGLLPLSGSSGTGGIPEVSVTEFSAGKLQEAIRDQGYLLVRGLLSAESSAELRYTIDMSMRARMEIGKPRASGMSNDAFYYESPYFPGKHAGFSAQLKKSDYGPTGSIMVADTPRGAFQVLENYRALELNGLLAEYFGEPAVIATRKWVFRVVPPRQMGGGWHQDGQFMGAGARALNMWIALSPCGDTTAAPGLALIPRRINEILEYGTRGAKIDWVVGVELIDELAAETPVVKPYFAAGDALFFDHLSLHRTGHAKDQDKTRYALESWFYAASGNVGNFVMPLY
tara:strand:+ start:10600 stop:11661 length:1062 start_codon:yes stop_codon:yes gene_type:complete